MEKDEKILIKIGKLLSRYGVSDEEKENFINDLKEYKDEEEAEPTENEEVEEHEELEGGEPMEEENVAAEQEQVDTFTNEQQEQPQGEEVANDSEEMPMEEPVEEPQEEMPVEQPLVEEEQGAETTTDESFDYKTKYDEAIKTIDGLTARLESLENVVSKLGVVKEDETLGASPLGSPVDEAPNDSFNDIIRKRIG